MEERDLSEKVEEKVEETTTEEKVEEKATEENPEKEKAKKRLSDRLKEERWKRGEAERKLEERDKRLKELEEQTKLKQEPDVDDYSDISQFEQDKQKWVAQERARLKEEARRELATEQEEKKQREQAEKLSSEWAKQQAKGKKNFDNWKAHEDEIVKTVNALGAWNIRDTIIDSKLGAELVNHLGQNPDELDEIASLPPSGQTRRILRLEAQLEAKPVKKLSSAPDPVRSGKGSAISQKDPNNMTPAEYIRWKNFGN